METKFKREGEKELFKIEPTALKPKERERFISETETEIRFVMNKEIKEKLEELRSLLGSRGIQMSLFEIFSYLTELGIENLKKQKFGQKRISQSKNLSLATPPAELKNRYISKAKHYEIWLRDSGKCTQCGSKNNLNIDHINPIAKGGSSHLSNLRILCFHCNQRAAMRIFGVETIKKHQVNR